MWCIWGIFWATVVLVGGWISGASVFQACFYSTLMVAAYLFLRFGAPPSWRKICLIIGVLGLSLTFMPFGSCLSINGSIEEINVGISEVERGVNLFSDYYDDHWMDYFRAKPLYH